MAVGRDWESERRERGRRSSLNVADEVAVRVVNVVDLARVHFSLAFAECLVCFCDCFGSVQVLGL